MLNTNMCSYRPIQYRKAGGGHQSLVFRAGQRCFSTIPRAALSLTQGFLEERGTCTTTPRQVNTTVTRFDCLLLYPLWQDRHFDIDCPNHFKNKISLSTEVFFTPLISQLSPEIQEAGSESGYFHQILIWSAREQATGLSVDIVFFMHERLA